jgi:Tol biopolymer transport system component
VAFQSDASNLSPADGNGVPDVFVRDLQDDTTILVSADASSKPAGGFLPQISSDGRDVVFSTPFSAANLFVRDLDSGTTEKVSVNSFGEDANDSVPGVVFAPQDLSLDGRFIAFESDATNLVDADTNDATDIFVHDRQAQTQQRPTPSPVPAPTEQSPAAVGGPILLPQTGGPPSATVPTVSVHVLLATAAAIALLILITTGIALRRSRSSS